MGVQWIVVLGIVAGLGVGLVLGITAGAKLAMVLIPEPDHSRCVSHEQHVNSLKAAYKWGIDTNERLIFGQSPASTPSGGQTPPQPEDAGQHQTVPWEDWPLPTTFPDPTDTTVPDDDGSRVAVGPLPTSPWLETPDMTGEML